MFTKIFAVFSFVAVCHAFRMPTHPDSRIVGGSEAVPHSYPHQAHLLSDLGIGYTLCGGTLISEEWVLSAAHCVDLPQALLLSTTVTLGAHNISAEEPEQQKILVDQIIIHELWNSTAIVNDVSLLHLSQPAVINEFVQIAALAAVEPAANETVTLTGWGILNSQEEDSPDNLRYVDVTVISDEQCRKTFFGLPDYEQTICTSGQGEVHVGACNGDSGGPMNYDGTVTGIASFVSGFGCAAGLASAYVSVPYHQDWIAEKTGITPPVV